MPHLTTSLRPDRSWLLLLSLEGGDRASATRVACSFPAVRARHGLPYGFSLPTDFASSSLPHLPISFLVGIVQRVPCSPRRTGHPVGSGCCLRALPPC